MLIVLVRTLRFYSKKMYVMRILIGYEPASLHVTVQHPHPTPQNLRGWVYIFCIGVFGSKKMSSRKACAFWSYSGKIRPKKVYFILSYLFKLRLFDDSK